MGSNLNGRLKKLEETAAPARRIIVLYEDEPAPADLGPDVVIIRVIYNSKDGQQNEQS